MRAQALTFLLFSTVLVPFAHAREWLLQPQTCVTATHEQVCEIELSIQFPDTLPGAFCLYLQQQKLKCWNTLPARDTLKLSFRQTSDLLLKDQAGNPVLKAKLTRKTLSVKRKRVRTPWSFF